jgi:hypothetical protein
VSMFMEHMHATGEATWCDWCFNEEEMSVSLMPLHNRFCLVTSLSCRVTKGKAQLQLNYIQELGSSLRLPNP